MLPGDPFPAPNRHSPVPPTRPPATVQTATRNRIAAEFAAAGLTWAAWEWAEAAGHKLYVFPVLLLGWVSYFAVKGLRRPELWRDWGLRITNWPRSIAWYVAATILALTVVGGWGLANDRFALPKHAVIIVALYPVWAFCQQFVLQNGVVANMRALGAPRASLPVVGMAAFAAVHLPDWELVALTAMGGLLWTWVWLRTPNLWLLALSHTIVGTAGFLLVLDRDPLKNFPQITHLIGGI